MLPIVIASVAGTRVGQRLAPHPRTSNPERVAALCSADGLDDDEIDRHGQDCGIAPGRAPRGLGCVGGRKVSAKSIRGALFTYNRSDIDHLAYLGCSI